MSPITEILDSDIMLASSIETLDTLENLGIPLPLIVPYKFLEIKTAQSGFTVGNGFPYQEWIWAYLLMTDRIKLRVLCPEPAMSAPIAIRTLSSEGEFEVYTGWVNWPLEEPMENSLEYRIPFVLKFTKLVPVPGLY